MSSRWDVESFASSPSTQRATRVDGERSYSPSARRRLQEMNEIDAVERRLIALERAAKNTQRTLTGLDERVTVLEEVQTETLRKAQREQGVLHDRLTMLEQVAREQQRKLEEQCRQLDDAQFEDPRRERMEQLNRLRKQLPLAEPQRSSMTALTLPSSPSWPSSPVADVAGSGPSLRDLVSSGAASHEDILATFASRKGYEGLLGTRAQRPGVIARRTWIFRGMQPAGTAAFRDQVLYSDEVVFGDAVDVRHRYAFKLCIWPGTFGSVYLEFIPRRGPEPAALVWPIQHRIRLSALSAQPHILEKVRVLDPSGDKVDRDFFATVAPPSANNDEGLPWSNFLTAEEYASGAFIFDGELLAVTAELLPPA